MARKTHIDPEVERWYQKYPRFPGVQVCAELLRNPNVRGAWVDTICHELKLHAPETLDQMMAVFRSEQDPWVKAMLLWSIGEARLPEAVPFLIENLQSEDERIQSYAAFGLHQADTKEARTALWQAGLSAL